MRLHDTNTYSHFFLKVVQEEISIPASFVKLSYLSSRTPGYKTLLRIILTHSTIPPGMTKVYLTVTVEGRLAQKWFPAATNLVYTFAWNKTDIYGQKVSGLAEAIGRYAFFHFGNVDTICLQTVMPAGGPRPQAAWLSLK